MAAPRAHHGAMAVPRAVARDEPGELAQRAAHAAYMDACWQHAKTLLDDLAAARRRAQAVLN